MNETDYVTPDFVLKYLTTLRQAARNSKRKQLREAEIDQRGVKLFEQTSVFRLWNILFLDLMAEDDK